MTGTVKWFDPVKGFGFIYGPDGQDVFVHYTAIQQEGYRRLVHDQLVEYELVRTPKGFQGRNVRVIGNQPCKEKPKTPDQAAQETRQNKQKKK
jgi:CspA family cold shock protein